MSMKPGGMVLTVIPERPELERQRLREPDDAGLGGDVVDHVRLTGLGARRGDVDDPAPPGLDHVGHHRLGEVEGSIEIHLHDPVPLLVGDLHELLEAGHPGVVDQDERRPDLGTDPLDGGVHLGAVGHVDTAGGHRLEPACRELAGHGVRRLAIQIEHHDGEPVLGQAGGDGPADARSGPGHEGDPAVAHGCDGHSSSARSYRSLVADTHSVPRGRAESYEEHLIQSREPRYRSGAGRPAIRRPRSRHGVRNRPATTGR